MANARKTFSSREKVSILRQHLLEKVPLSDLCDQHELHPTLFYRWQKVLFEKGAAAFERNGDSTTRRLEKQNAVLRAKLASKDEVIAEIMESHVQLKKNWRGLKASSTQPDVRDEVIDYVRYWSDRTELAATKLVG